MFCCCCCCCVVQHEATLAEFTSKLRAFRPTATVLEAEIARVSLELGWGDVVCAGSPPPTLPARARAPGGGGQQHVVTDSHEGDDIGYKSLYGCARPHHEILSDKSLPSIRHGYVRPSVLAQSPLLTTLCCAGAPKPRRPHHANRKGGCHDVQVQRHHEHKAHETRTHH